MNARITAAAIVLALCLQALPATSEEAAPPPVASSHEQAVAELIGLMELEKAMTGMFTTMVDAQIQANPAIAPYRDVMLAWASKFMSWDLMAPSMIKLQMDNFTEPEVRDMIAFYRSATGQKALKKMPELLKQGAQIGVEMAKAHQAELEAMVLERQKQLEAEEKKP